MANPQKKNHNLRSRCRIPTTSWNFSLSLSVFSTSHPNTHLPERNLLWIFNISTTRSWLTPKRRIIICEVVAEFPQQVGTSFSLCLTHSHSIPSPTSTPSQSVSQSEKNFVRPKSIEHITLSEIFFLKLYIILDRWMKERRDGGCNQCYVCVRPSCVCIFNLSS